MVIQRAFERKTRRSISALDTFRIFLMPRLNRRNSTVFLNFSALSSGFSSRALLEIAFSSFQNHCSETRLAQ